MKREIKFRAFNKINGKMSTMYGFGLDMSGKITVNRENEVMQFTGLRDKNGKEIYEGDIVNCWGWGIDANFQKTNEKWGEGLRVVKWTEAWGGFSLQDTLNQADNHPIWHSDAFEVVGNIFNDNHLLPFPISIHQ